MGWGIPGQYRAGHGSTPSDRDDVRDHLRTHEVCLTGPEWADLQPQGANVSPKGPTKSPKGNKVEPKWVYVGSKRANVEPKGANVVEVEDYFINKYIRIRWSGGWAAS